MTEKGRNHSVAYPGGDSSRGRFGEGITMVTNLYEVFAMCPKQSTYIIPCSMHACPIRQVLFLYTEEEIFEAGMGKIGNWEAQI